MTRFSGSGLLDRSAHGVRSNRSPDCASFTYHAQDSSNRRANIFLQVCAAPPQGNPPKSAGSCEVPPLETPIACVKTKAAGSSKFAVPSALLPRLVSAHTEQRASHTLKALTLGAYKRQFAPLKSNSMVSMVSVPASKRHLSKASLTTFTKTGLPASTLVPVTRPSADSHFPADVRRAGELRVRWENL
jgi:hypothetical protein